MKELRGLKTTTVDNINILKTAANSNRWKETSLFEKQVHILQKST